MSTPFAVGESPICRTAGQPARFGAKTRAEMDYPFLLNPEYVTVQVSGTTTTYNDVYPVLAGKRAFVVSSFGYSASVQPKQYLKRSSTYYQLSTITTLLNAGFILLNGFVYEEGDTISFHHGGSSTITNYQIALVVFDAPVSGARGLKTHVITNLANGANTLFTVGANCKMGWPNFSTSAVTMPVGGGAGTIAMVMNNSGGTRSYDLNLVPSGGSADATNIFKSATSANDAARASFTPGGLMAAGDTCVVTTNSGASGQFAFATTCEF